jgi:hypothetical protein
VSKRRWEKATTIEIRQRNAESNERKRQARISESELRPSELPVLPYVPHIELTENSKYVMRPPA